MEAIILVGGAGTRLEPLTDNCPKPLLPLVGRPIVEHVAARLASFGVTRVVLATGHLTERFTPEVLLGLSDRVEVAISAEPAPLGTGGAIGHALPMIRLGASDAVLVLNGDSLSSHDLKAQLDQHDRARPAVTVHVRATQDVRGMGLVECDDNGTVTQFLEKPPCKVAGLVNAGTYVLSRWAVEQLAAVGPTSLERDVLPGWAAEGLVRAYREDSYLADVGTIDGYLSTTRDLVLGLVATTVAVCTSAPGVHREAIVDDSAQVGDGSFVDTGAHVGARTAVLRSVLLPGSQVGADCRVTDAVLAPGAVVPDGSTVSGIVAAGR